MLSREFDYVVIDGEAGIEQINRRVLEKVTHLLLVSDQSRKGIQVVGTIKQVADELVMYDRIGAVINRVTNPDLNKFITLRFFPISSRTTTTPPTTSRAKRCTIFRRSRACTAERRKFWKSSAFSERRAIKLINKGQTTRERNQKGV